VPSQFDLLLTPVLFVASAAGIADQRTLSATSEFNEMRFMYIISKSTPASSPNTAHSSSSARDEFLEFLSPLQRCFRSHVRAASGMHLLTQGSSMLYV